MTGLTGGIGSGKSVVAHVLTIKGYEVVDSDTLARRLMDESAVVKDRIAAEIDTSCVRDGLIDRRRLADIVFSDVRRLAVLNDIVHGLVRERLAEIAAHATKPFFVETAIFGSSGLWRLCSAELRVTAPEELRVERVMRRNGLSADAVRARIAAQRTETLLGDEAPPLFIIENDGHTAVLPQVDTFLATLSPPYY